MDKKKDLIQMLEKIQNPNHLEAGMPPQVLKTILGHSSLAMTMDLYSHVLPDTKADEMQKIANVF